MKFYLSLLLPAIFITLPVLGQDGSDEDLLEWNEYYNLSWEDFQGSPGDENVGDAGTHVHIKAKPFYVKDQVMYDVDAYFNRKKSWARAKSESLLRHEKLHFDIAELYARLIRKKISDLQAQGVNDIQVFNTAIRTLLAESNELDQQYDLETLHGVLSKKQAYWEAKVKEQLIGLRDYKKRKRVITVKDAMKKRQHIFG